MDSVWTLIILSLAMFIGCYISGLIPLVVSLSEERMEIVTVFGAGLLVGTALTVIIPEGVNTLLKSDMTSRPTLPNINAKDGIIIVEKQPAFETHSVIGISLLVGFIFMLFVDWCSGSHYRQVPDSENAVNSVPKSKSSLTATLGLVVHAAADGIALGAAAASSHTDVEMIVFFAIMLHKTPAAFGLVTFLLHEGLERNRIRRHLLVFATAAPVGALVTFGSIVQSGSESLSSSQSTGIAMLFSAGTFLYVSTVHVLPELASKRGDGAPGSFSCKQLTSLIIGCVLPVFLSLGHHH